MEAACFFRGQVYLYSFPPDKMGRKLFFVIYTTASRWKQPDERPHRCYADRLSAVFYNLSFTNPNGAWTAFRLV